MEFIKLTVSNIIIYIRPTFYKFPGFCQMYHLILTITFCKRWKSFKNFLSLKLWNLGKIIKQVSCRFWNYTTFLCSNIKNNLIPLQQKSTIQNYREMHKLPSSGSEGSFISPCIYGSTCRKSEDNLLEIIFSFHSLHTRYFIWQPMVSNMSIMSCWQ